MLVYKQNSICNNIWLKLSHKFLYDSLKLQSNKLMS